MSKKEYETYKVRKHKCGDHPPCGMKHFIKKGVNKDAKD